MKNLVRRFSFRLVAILAAATLVAPTVAWITAEQVASRIARDEANAELQNRALAFEANLAHELEKLRSISTVLLAPLPIPSDLNQKFEALLQKNVIEIAIGMDSLGNVEAKTASNQGIGIEQNLLRKQKENPQERIISGIILENKTLFVFHIHNSSEGSIILAQSIDLGLFANEKVSLGVLNAPQEGDNTWNIKISASNEKDWSQSFNSIHIEKNRSGFFTQERKNIDRAYLLKQIDLEGAQTGLTLALETLASTSASVNAFNTFWENIFLSTILITLLTSFTGLLLWKSLSDKTEKLSLALSAKDDEQINEADFEFADPAFQELARVSREIAKIHNKQNEVQNDQWQRKIYELERRCQEHSLQSKILQKTNFQTGLFEVMSNASDVLVTEFGIGNVFLFRKSVESADTALVFVKKKISHSGQIITSREVVPALDQFNDDEMNAIREEGWNAIASGRLHRVEIPRADSLAPLRIATLPITFSDGANGALCLVPEAKEYFFTDEDEALLERIGVTIGEILQQSRLNDTSVVDSLTRLYNYRHFQSQLGIEMMRARRSSLPMCLFAIEIDDFNLFATNRENQLAEKVIQETAAILRTVCRSTDVISRKDKSLFLLICPDTPMLGATIVAEKIRTAIAANQVQSQRGPVKITVSLGAAFFPAQAIIAKDLLDICLANLGKAHSDGGNCAKIDPQTISPQKS